MFRHLNKFSFANAIKSQIMEVITFENTLMFLLFSRYELLKDDYEQTLRTQDKIDIGNVKLAQGVHPIELEDGNTIIAYIWDQIKKKDARTEEEKKTQPNPTNPYIEYMETPHNLNTMKLVGGKRRKKNISLGKKTRRNKKRIARTKKSKRNSRSA
jgi:hypothetical protein